MTRQSARTIIGTPPAGEIAATIAAATQAKDYIAAPTGIQHSEDTEQNELPDRLMKSTGDASESMKNASVSMVSDAPMDKDWLDNMAFMAELIDIQVAETEDPQAEQIFEININGRAFVFRRGETKTVPRYVADHMLRMKRTSYTQKEVHNSEGIKDIVHQPRSNLKYPLMVLRDNSPLSQRWFQFTTSLRG